MWVIRGGDKDELVDRFVEQGVIGLVLPDLPDAEILTRSEIRRFLAGDASAAALDALEASTSAFVREISVGDSVLLLDASRAEVVVGTVTGRYEFDGGLPADDVRHRRSVEWLARHPVGSLPPAVQRVAKQRADLEQHRDAEWSAYLAEVRDGGIGKDPADRPARAVSPTTRRSPSRPAAPRVVKPVLAMRTCPGCFLQKHPDRFVGEYCADCAE